METLNLNEMNEIMGGSGYMDKLEKELSKAETIEDGDKAKTDIAFDEKGVSEILCK